MKRISFFLFSFLIFLCLVISPVCAADTTIYRVYHPGNGEHLYTSDANEAKTLVRLGWNDEGIGWIAPDKGQAVYRLYNAELQNHLYTTDTNEVSELTSKHGWTKDYDGKPLFYSGGSIPVYRVYNKDLRGMHHLTTDKNEYNVLPNHGWSQEGIALYGTKITNSESNNKPGNSTQNPEPSSPDDSSSDNKPEQGGNNSSTLDPTKAQPTAFQKSLTQMTKKYPFKSNSASDYATSRLIIRLTSGTIDPTAYGATEFIQDSEDPTLYIAQFNSESEAQSAKEKISKSKNIKYVEPDLIAEAYDIENDYSLSSFSQNSNTPHSWGVSAIGADSFAQSITSNSPVYVAVVDSGISNHEFLGSRRSGGGYDFIDEDTDPKDESGHGTHVAGTIIDCTPGLNVNVLAVRVLNADGKGTMSTVAEGIKFAADSGVRVINLSLGGGHSERVDEAVAYAINKNIVVCIASGNKNKNVNTSNFCPAHLNNQAIIVGAVDKNLNKAYFSNYGDSIDIVAPGVDIESASHNGTFRLDSGTSMACPHVSAAAALLILENPQSTPTQIENKLKMYAKDLGPTGWDKEYGFGLVQLPYTKVEEPNKPSQGTDEPAEEPNKPSQGTDKPVEEPNNPSQEPDKPVDEPNGLEFGSLTNLQGRIALSNDCTTFIDKNNNLYQWGTFYDSLNQKFNDPILVPELVTRNVKYIARENQSFDNVYAAITNDGKLYTWGLNTYGVLGHGDYTKEIREPKLILENVKQVDLYASIGAGIALKEDGTVWSWGNNKYGDLGRYTVSNSEQYIPQQISELSDITQISAGGNFNLALKSDGTVWSWGRGDAGALGTGSTSNQYTPKRIMGLPKITYISAGTQHAGAIDEEGYLWTWGDNYTGLLCDGTNSDSYKPIKVLTQYKFKQISFNSYDSALVTTDGKLLADFGYNIYTGMLYKQKATNVAFVYSGPYHSLFVKNDGTVWGWGSNSKKEITANPEVYTYEEPVKITN